MEWEKKWVAAVNDISGDLKYEDSSQVLRNLIKSGLLRFDDMEKNPERFFLAHRRLVNPVRRGPGFWIRFTVQYNLFAGTVLGLGGPEHLAQLEAMQQQGTLGCFGLTEQFAGVNSGLVVNTIATWLPEKQSFRIHSPDEGSYKNWISQGLTAEKCALIANLIIDGKAYGPHGFLIDLRRNGQVVDGITLGDMGRKTTGNDLDNAWIRFDNVLIDKNALLNKFADIVDNKYVQTTKERMRIEIIGQRLLTGRVAVAQAALQFARMLYTHTKKYSDSKKCWSPGSTPCLSDIPQLHALYQDAFAQLGRMDAYCAVVESKLCETLTVGGIPPPDLVHAIAVAKVNAVERAIDLCHRLKQEVGSYALMGDTGFEHLDFLNCCKFAEGDSRILMQKMARDRVREYSKGIKGTGKIAELCEVLHKGGSKKWNDNFAVVYNLAAVIISDTMTQWGFSKAKL